ncbi:MAG TPA: class I SAM-dependent methyltransferase [Candidatus Saccharimonadales bacterium]|nr:class I SAM-dependent methyltransferase [Candidatus Saccharimonadales bacterium]
MAKEYFYTAQDNLETMKDAVNYNRYQRDFIQREISKLKNKKVKILDFGAGIGTYADMLRELGHKIDCVEKGKVQAKILRQKKYKTHEDIKHVKTKYDVIYSLNVLEHIKDDKKILASLKDCLSKEGVIIIYVPAFMSIFSNLDVKAEHFRRYRIKDLKKLANQTNLELKRIKYCDPVGFMLAIVYRIIGGSGNLNPKTIGIFDKYLFPVSALSERIFKKMFGKNVLGVFARQ